MSENQNKAVLTKELLNRKTLEQGLTEEQGAQSKQLVWNECTCQERSGIALVYVYRCF